ncbi:MAG: hydrogenase maturation protease [Acidobacteria bacterium]|nr:hydrogenase maturation protease [Acidobacteriota bacterium]
MVDPSGSVLVIGCGNPQRGDDGVAWKVLDALRAAPPRLDAPPLLLKRVHQLAPELAEPASRARAVIFVDARADAEAGTVSCEPVEPGPGSAFLTHSLSPQEVLLYAERLFGHVPRAAVVTVGGTSFGHGSELSAEVLRAVPKAARRIRSLARLWARRPLCEPAGPSDPSRSDGPRPASP